MPKKEKKDVLENNTSTESGENVEVKEEKPRKKITLRIKPKEKKTEPEASGNEGFFSNENAGENDNSSSTDEVKITDITYQNNQQGQQNQQQTITIDDFIPNNQQNTDTNQQQNQQFQNINQQQNNQQNQGYFNNNRFNNRNGRYFDRNNNKQPEEEFVINTEQVVYVKDLREKKLDDLIKMAEEYEVQNLNRMLRPDIITSILKKCAEKGEGIYCDGYLEIINEGGFGFLRDQNNNYKSSSYDVYVSQNYIKKLGLRQGDLIEAYIKEPKNKEKYFAVARLEKINGKKVDEIKNKINFDNLTPLYPTERLKFSKMNNPKEAISTRVMDLICPIGKGQRALIVAPPRAGKTVLMQAIAHAINENHPEVDLIVLLIDERPEEVTDMQRSVKGEVVSSTFDEPATRHVELAEIVIEKARRMVEDGRDVIILLDSITRLARAYNAVAPSSGKVLTGGVDSNALQKPKRFFGSARNIENGGSLTIIATSLVETGSKMDEVIFEEFKGTGNAEIVLDRKLADKRLFPAIDILKSGTRREEEMVSKDELTKMWILRRILITMAGTNATNSADALEFLLDKLKKTKDNEEFYSQMNSSK